MTTPHTGVRPIPVAHLQAIFDRKPTVCIPAPANDIWTPPSPAAACNRLVGPSPEYGREKTPAPFTLASLILCALIVAYFAWQFLR
jgi:hypothetical protein